MPNKVTGIGDNLYVDGTNISGDTQGIARVGGGPSPLDMTDITQGAYARQGGIRGGEINWVSFFDKQVGQSHLKLRGLPTADVQVSYFRGTALGGPAASLVAKQIGYDPTRGADGMLTFAVNAMSNAYGLEWGEQLTAGVKTDTSATNGTGIDYGAVSTLFGWQAYLHVFAVTGTSVTVTVQDSADNVTFANLTGGAFTAVAGAATSAQRLAGGSTATVRRYVRAITTGTFTNAQFAVSFVRNVSLVTF